MEVKPLHYKELPGLSEQQLSEHHDVLYAGYVKKVDEIRGKLLNIDYAAANPTYSEVRELKLEEGFALDGVKLHELYFTNMGGDGKPKAEMADLINLHFGSYEKWKEEFMAMGMSARGWVVLALDEEDILRHFICDAHNQGGIWNVTPVLVLDVYEHAYIIDYGTKRKDYLEAFCQNIDWDVVFNRFPITR